MNAEIEAARREFRLVTRIERYPIVYGDANGVIYDQGASNPNRIRVRYITAAGMASGLPPVLPPGSGFVGNLTPGGSGWAGYDYDGTACILAPNNTAQAAQGFNVQLNNPAAIPPTQAAPDVSTDQIVQFTSHPTSPVSAFLVVRSLKWVLGGVPKLFKADDSDGSGGLKGLKDLTSFFPAAGNQCLIAYFLKLDNTVEIVASTTQLITVPINFTDVEELYAAATPGGIAGQAWKLVDGQTTLTDANWFMDLRDFIDQHPPVVGSATLVSGVATVSTPAVTANSLIFLTPQESGVITGFLKVSARVAGTSFSIASSVLTDTAKVAWQIIEP